MTIEPDPPSAPPGPATEEMLRVTFTRRQLLAFVAFVVLSIALMYFVLPQLLGLQKTWKRIQHGDAWWLGLAAALELASVWAYIALFRAVFARGAEQRIDWRASYQITMAGLAATRLFAAAGAGGIVLTSWALRRAGFAARVAARRLVAFMVIQYGVYMGTLVVCGLGLYLGVIPGRHPFAITIVPAIFAAVVIALFLAISLLPEDFGRLAGRWGSRGGWRGAFARRSAIASGALGSGVRIAIELIRNRDSALLWAIAWWGFNIAVLWACFHAFGYSPPKGVIVMGYFVGMLGNTLPLPGGIGGVDGGMIGALTAFGIPVQGAVVSVLAYRVFAFWLPTLPGAIAYLQLRRTVHRWRAEPAGAAS